MAEVSQTVDNMLREFICTHQVMGVYEFDREEIHKVRNNVDNKLRSRQSYDGIRVAVRGNKLILSRPNASAGDSESMYQFPANKRALGTTVQEQVLKLMEECGETAAELAKAPKKWHEDLFLMELEDAKWALEGIERKFSVDAVRAARNAVADKASRRGDIA